MDIKSKLLTLSENDYKRFSAKLIPGCKNILGVRLPVLRRLARDIAAEDYTAFLNSQSDYFEETMLKGMVIGALKKDLSEVLPLIKNFIPLIDNWSVCDSFCAGLKITRKNMSEMFAFVTRYSNGSEFEQRFTAVMLMDFFLTDEYIDRVLEIYLSMKNDGYYQKMAVAWGLCTAAAKFPEKAEGAINDERLDSETRRYTIAKIRDSFRISDSDKAKYRA